MPIEVIALLTTAIINITLVVLILKSQRNHIGLFYSVFVLFVAAWSIGVAFFILEKNLERAIWLANGYYVVAAGIPMFFLYFSLHFPLYRTISFFKKSLIFIPTILFSIIFIINKNFLIQEIFITAQRKSVILNKPHYFLYMFYFGLFVILSYVFLVKKYIVLKNNEEKIRLKFIIIGTAISYIFGIFFNLFFPWFGNYHYIWLGPVFSLIMVVSIGYAVAKHHLFNAKVISTELLTSGLIIFIFIRTLIAETLKEQIINGTLLFITTIFGIFLIRSVLKEVRAREEIEQLATKLEFANLRLKQLDEAKSDFISIASHQLRTPLTAIKGYASMILEGSYGKITNKLRGPVDNIFQSSQRLTLIIGDFLDVSHIERGTMEYNFEKTDLREMLNGLFEEFQAALPKMNNKAKNLKLIFKADPDADFSVKVDKNTIRQVFSNLIDNSIKYTEEGSVKIFLYIKEENGKVMVKIEDTGIGIAKDVLPNLFRKFVRAKGHASLHANGSGLGLYVAKEIIKAHKGKIWAESEGEGKGSRFFVELEGK